MADKYTDAEIEAMGKKGQAFKNPDGHYSYPIADEADLDNAIKAVGRGGADHDAIRKYITGRAKALGLSAKIPDTWNADGSVSEANAAARAAFELRRRRRGSMIRMLERRRMPFTRGNIELRAKPDGTGGTTYEFEGYGAVFDTPFDMWDPWGDEYVEVVRQGAFTQTLAASPDVPFLIGHNDMGVPLARTRSGTMQLSQDTRGLHVLAQMDGARSDVRNLASAVDRGDLDEMSIGFVTMPGGQQWSPDWMQRDMLSLDLHRGDVSAVALAANPSTAGSTMIALSSGRPRERRAPTQPYTAHPGEVNECPQCHSMNDNTASFCDQCGKKMMPASHVSNMQGVEEMSQGCGCGKWNSADARYCGGCGRELGGDDSAASYSSWWAQNRPGEQRAARGEINDSSNQPDFNLPAGTPAYNASAHGSNSLTCPHDSCPVYSGGDGARALNAQDAKHCDQCGGPLYNGDGLIVADDSGVVEEVGGDMADADLLSRRLRLLELA
jgi:HK97 family phage prohead protease